jgi:hypothetical protein
MGRLDDSVDTAGGVALVVPLFGCCCSLRLTTTQTKTMTTTMMTEGRGEKLLVSPMQPSLLLGLLLPCAQGGSLAVGPLAPPAASALAD